MKKAFFALIIMCLAVAGQAVAAAAVRMGIFTTELNVTLIPSCK
jgi:hypothetical protein